MKFCRSPVVNRIIVCVVMMALIMSGGVAYSTPIRAEEIVTAPIMTTNSTGDYVDRVKDLAKDLKEENSPLDNSGNSKTISWDGEKKNRSWTYYNGIMMDAFLMLFSEHGNDTTSEIYKTYETYVNGFYENNIDPSPPTQPRNSNTNNDSSKSKDKGPVNSVGASDNYYRENELDSIPPSRALFDLIASINKKSNNTAIVSDGQKTRYKNTIDYVYSVLLKHETIGLSSYGYTGAIQKHKYPDSLYGSASTWVDRPIALDGLYMAQPFFMELANALDSGDLTVKDGNQSDDFTTYSKNVSNYTKPVSNTIYTEVYNRMMFVHDKLYDTDDELYNHAWGSEKGVNGQYWLRAIGWYAAALADVISMMPDSHSTERQALIGVETQLFDGMMKSEYQDSTTGMWRNVVNEGEDVDDATTKNQYETSGSALVAYAMMKAYAEHGVDAKYGKAGLKAFNGTIQNKLSTDNKTLSGIYLSSGVYTNAYEYLDKSRFVDNEAKGVGPLMMAASYANEVAGNLVPEFTAPTGQNLAYTGSAQNLVTAGSTSDGTIYYALGSDSTTAPETGWSTDIPQATNTGTYYVWYKVVGDANHIDTEPGCLSVGIIIPPHKHEDGTVFETAWTDRNALPTTAGSYYLTEDVTLSSAWIVPSGTTSLCLNEFSITLNAETGSVIHIPSSAILNLYDCKVIGTITGGNTQDSAGAGVYNDGTFNMYGGEVYDNSASTGAGVYNDGTFNMYWGTVYGNSASTGAGVYNNNIFNMYGGFISSNTASSDGGGVYNAAEFTMYGGDIIENTALQGSAVKNGGSFHMSGGSIRGNNSESGYAVFNEGTIFLSGCPFIRWNDNKNLYLPSKYSTITIEDVLSDDAEIGITMEEPGVFTSGLDGKGNASNFTSDDSNYIVCLDGSGEAKLASPLRVTYEANGGSGDVPTDTTVYYIDATVTVAAADRLVNTGLAFSGWNTKADGSGDSYAPGDTFTIEEDTVLHAQWEAIPATAPTIDTQPGNLNLTYGYDSGSLTINASVADGHTLSYQWYAGTSGEPIAGATEAVYAIPTGKPAGTQESYYCVVTATRTDNGEKATATSGSATVTVDKKPLTITANSASRTYTGEALTESSYSSEGLVEGDTIESVTITGSQTDVGESENVASVAVIKKGEIIVTGNYDISYVKGTLTVTKATSTVTKAPEGKDLTYTGEAQALVSAGEADGGTMQYALGTDSTDVPESDWSTTIPTGIYPGTYYVWYKVFGDENHSDTVPACVEVVINQTNVSVSARDKPTGTELPGAFLQIIDDEGKVVEAWQSDGTVHDRVGLKAGKEYTLKCTEAPDGYATPSDITFSIDTEGHVTGETMWDGIISVYFTMASKTPIEPTVSIEGWTYGEESKTPTVEGNPGGGTVTYQYKEKDGDYTDAVPTNAGEYIVKATVEATDNYESGTATANFTIAKKPVAIKANDQDVPLNGTIKTDTSQIFDEELFKGLLSGHSLAEITLTASSTANVTTDGTITPSDAKIVNGDEDVTGNYEITYQPGVLTVEKGEVVIETPPTATAITYGETLVDSQLTGSANVDGAFIWKEPDTKPSVADSNKTEYDVVFTPTNTDNYDPVTIKVKVEVNKADQDAPSAPQAASTTATSITLTAVDGYEYSKDGQIWQSEPTFTGLEPNKEYTFYQRKKGDDNHNESPSSAPATISTTAHEHQWTYAAKDGGVIVATCSAEGHVEDVSHSITLSAPANQLYGSATPATVSGSIEGVNNPNIIYTKDGVPVEGVSKSAGSYTASITLGTATASIEYTIEPKPVKVEGLEIAQKTYDGNTEASFTGTPRLVIDDGIEGLGAGKSFTVVDYPVEPGDEVILDAEAEFVDSAVGDNKDVNVTLSLSGADAGNYRLTSRTMRLTGNILPAEETIIPPTARENLVALGNPRTLINPGSAPEGQTMQYAIGTDDTTAPTEGWTRDDSTITGTDPGTYYVWYRVVDDENTVVDGPKCIKVKIKSAQSSAGDLPVDGFISVSGLSSGDKVNFYQVLEFDPDAIDTGGWVATSDFSELTEEQIQKMLRLADYATGKSKAGQAGIDETLAAKIAAMASTATYADIAAVKDGDTYTAKKDNPVAGLYLALVTPGQAKVVYNPIFVAADYHDKNGTNAWTVNLEDSYEPASMAKKSEITLEKKADTLDAQHGGDGNPDGVAVGDTLVFKVETKIPEYSNDYESAVFKLSDVLSEGLELQPDSIKVYKDTVDATNLLTASDTYSSGVAYKLTSDTSGTKDTFTVDFYTQYILGLSAAQDIVVEYQATVTTDAPKSVNLETNTVTLNYSTTPSDTTGKGTLKDETKHYTFDIDANILGDDSWKTTEVVKVGVGADGKEITQSTIHEGQSVGALEGATFKLYVATDHGSTTKLKGEDGEFSAKPYTNSIISADSVIVSDSSGRLTIQGQSTPGIRGLDLGTYYLVEESAPAGYVKWSNAVKIEIEATGWKDMTYTEDGVTWSVKELEGYKVSIDGAQTANYTFLNSKDVATSAMGASSDKAVKGDTITGAGGAIGPNASAGAYYGKIVNTQGAELPSTGGAGTKIFYGIGAVLMLMGSILLVSKRRARAV